MKNNMENQVAVFLTNVEAEKFKEFQRYHDTFILLIDKGVFDVKNGSVTLNFDPFGTITTIQRSDMLYNHRIK